MLKKMKIAAFFAVATPLAATAQLPEFDRFVTAANAAAPAPTASESEPVALAALQQREREGGRCVPTGVRLDAPRSITATRHIVQLILAQEAKNAWTVYARMVGCPESGPTLVALVRAASGELVAAPMLVGETIANPTLVLDVRMPAMTAAVGTFSNAVPPCNGAGGIRLESVRVLSRSDDLGPDYHGVRFRGSWREGWTFAACGRRVEVPIAFTADGESGANWQVLATEARLLD